MNIKFKLHEWAANNFSFIQYPQIRQVHYAKKVNKLAFIDRVLLLIIGTALGSVGLLFVCVGLFMLYVIFAA